MTESKNIWARKWIGLDCHNELVDEMCSRVADFCARWFRNDPKLSLLLICGNPNCGKSHTAKKVNTWARFASNLAWTSGKWQNPPSVLFCLWPEITDDFKQGNYGFVDDMVEADLLIIDDIGAEHDPSKSATNKLCQILSRREKKFTLITTNIKPEYWTSSFDSRITDRFLRNSDVVMLFDLPSYAMK